MIDDSWPDWYSFDTDEPFTYIRRHFRNKDARLPRNELETRMIEEIFPDIFRIEIPLPKSPLRTLNAYVIRSLERSLVVDTGWNRDECLCSMVVGLEEAKVDLDKTDFFITHCHADHLGLVERLRRKETRIYLGERDASVANSSRSNPKERLDRLCLAHLAHGFPEPELRVAVENHPGFLYGPTVPLSFTCLQDGDRLVLGNNSFRCIQTPGHSPGHMCLYDSGRKLLLSGDHILFDITPNITRWPEMDDSLERYFESLDRVYHLDVKLVLPGHRRIMNNHRKRIRELFDHHLKRLNEVLQALKGGEKTAWDVAPSLSWDLDCDSWSLLPPAQKWFALGETVAHLNFLASSGKVKTREFRGKILFSATGQRKTISLRKGKGGPKEDS